MNNHSMNVHHTSSNYSIQSQSQSQPSPRSSDGTTGTSASTLFPPPSSTASTFTVNGPGDGGLVQATNNIMNSVADASSSLFQICVSLKERLMGVPGFAESLQEEDEQADDDTDPVTLLWRTFRRGYPLMYLYNALNTSTPLSLAAGIRDDKKGKVATFKFLQACVNDLKFPQEECFIVTDLYGDDTTGFVKVAKVVNRVLDILVARNLIEDRRPSASDFEQANKSLKKSQRQHIISELVTTERTYVQHLELLQAFKHLVEEKGIIPGDAVHDIFLNLNSLLDFQRRFLIRVEQTNSQPEEEQNWGKLFLLYNEAFKVYEPYIANQRKCEKTVVAEYSKLREAGGNEQMRQMVESSTSLYGFLMKPFQRLSKYPLLLNDLYKKGDLDDERKQDLLDGKEAATSVLERTNVAVDREEKAEAVQELKYRVEDWKGHRVEGFGELMLYGTFTVLKSENLASGRDGERQYHVYLFETILLCCKDIDLSKPKNQMKLSKQNLVDKRGKPKLQLKGRIFMQNVTDLVSLAKPGTIDTFIKIRSSERIFWKGDPSIENFIIRFKGEDDMKKWAQQIEAQRRRYRESRTMRSSDGFRTGGTSVTEFAYMQNQPALENPYAEEDEEDQETLVGSGHPSWANSGGYPAPGDFPQSRNGSSTSLRSRSTTGNSDGQAVMSSRAGPPRFTPGQFQSAQQPLTLRTQQLQQQAQSPGTVNAESYFSPTGESPLSSGRTSTSSNAGMYPFPRQAVPQNAYYEEGHGATRFTAPAMARRAPSGGAPGNTYAPPRQGSNGDIQPRPYIPASGMHSSQQMPQPRNRSASSPDIHNGQPGRAPIRNGASQPPVPEVPIPYQQNPHMIPRSQSNSPNLPNGGPPGRQVSQSPQLARERSYQQRAYAQQDSLPTNGYPQDDRKRSDLGSMQAYPSSRTITPVPAGGASAFPAPPPQTCVPPTPTAATTMSELAPPTQLKVKVNCPAAGQTLTLVVPLNISYQSLKDRIDAKLQRSTTITLSDRGDKSAQVKLKYLDEEDFVSIQSDEDVQTAFETWREQRADGLGGMGEIELFCQR
ncbi:hypothetical protein EJ03DRAFT_360510 [Teratosphaeria nubilosa]|uniref:DH domain-containing protein n=1 Tax=Teratosphaeria nubilosa TaxID=161662 RepID=A0A6G1LCZ0_9PEZI|nr:hypothetical protein EJ03DRAFT_360510 [Teratosphaeria nubilosa]